MRFLLTGVVAIAACGFTSIMAGALLPAPLSYGANLFGLAAGFLAGRQVWKRHGQPVDAGLLSAMTRGALTLGGIGFVAGFFGPMLLAPGANQGPMLGLFITGPGGFLLGGVGGAAWWATRGRRGAA